MENFAEIYETMLGFRTPEAYVPGVEDAFSEGSLCQREYDRMRGAYERLCTRLSAGDEDPDLNTIVDAMEAIQRDLCKRMYHCGQTKKGSFIALSAAYHRTQR